MDPLIIGYLSLAGITIAIFAGVHVAIALAGISFLSIWAMVVTLKLSINFLALAATESISEYTFGVVPLFVLMRLTVSESGMERDTFAILSRGLRNWRGGLGVATVSSNAVFAAITGISIASAAVFSKVAVPEMIRAGTARSVAVGVVAGSSVLGMLIPPSMLMILIAILTDSSIGDQFLAGVVPGILLTLAFALYLTLLGHFRPELFDGFADRGAADSAPRWRLLPVLSLAALFLGGIYGGIFTPTEAGAVGAAAALVMAIAMRRIDGSGTWRIAVQTGHVTAAVCFLIVGASIYGRMLAYSGVPGGITEWAVNSGVGPTGFLLAFTLIVALMGTILDSSSIMLVTVPLAFPITQELGIDVLHLGLVTVLAVEIGLLTPPLGLSVFVVQAALQEDGVTLGEVFRGAAPYAAIMSVLLVLIVLFPMIATGIVQ